MFKGTQYLLGETEKNLNLDIRSSESIMYCTQQR
jgi:hypothetical protein